jgi:hypothetical protein
MVGGLGSLLVLGGGQSDCVGFSKSISGDFEADFKRF